MENIKAPSLTLPDQNNALRSLEDYRGKWVVLYFYPKDDTPGCTTEACSFRDEYGYLQEHGVQVLGISKDSVQSHAKFADKYSLSFPILSDTSLTIIKAYGAWGIKKFMGREFEGTIRKTFLIDPNGIIVKEYPNVTPKDHVITIIQELEALKMQGNS